MARYFFHLRDGERLLSDDDGEELRDLGAVRSYAIDSARQLLSQAALSGTAASLHQLYRSAMLRVPKAKLEEIASCMTHVSISLWRTVT